MLFLVPFIMAIGKSRSFGELREFSFSGSTLSVFSCLGLQFDSWICHMFGMFFLLV